MYIRKTRIENCDKSNDYNKGLLDTFEPVVKTKSKNYDHWVAVIDSKICISCLQENGKIFYNGEKPDRPPPLHPNCRCQIEDMEAIPAGFSTKNGINGADVWLQKYGILPEYYITEQQASSLGWPWGKPLTKYAPGKMLTRGIYKNSDKKLPSSPGRIWYEADINYYEGRRNRHRILWSNDGLIFVTYNHYFTFYEII